MQARIQMEEAHLRRFRAAFLLLRQASEEEILSLPERIASNDPTINVVRDSFDDIGAEELGGALRQRNSFEKPNLINILVLERNSELSSRGVRAVAPYLQGCVKYFDCFAEIGDEGAAEIVRGLSLTREEEARNTVKWLHLCDNRIGDEGLTNISNNLLASPSCTLSTFRFKSAHVSFAGWQSLGRALRINTSLTELALQGVDERSSCVLFEAIKHNTNLTALKLDSNKVGDAGAAVLGDVLRLGHKTSASAPSGPPLNHIGLRHNMITDEGAIAIAQSLKDNASLLTLDLVGNDISETGALALLHAVEQNCIVEDVHISRFETTASLARRIGYYCMLNRMGRRHVGNAFMPSSLLPLILAKQSINKEPGVLFGMLRERPDIFQRQDKIAAPECERRKRHHEDM